MWRWIKQVESGANLSQMTKSYTIILFYTSLLCLVWFVDLGGDGSVTFAASGSTSTSISTLELLPSGIKGVGIGMTKKQLLALRTSVVADDFGGFEQSAISYSEELLNHPFFLSVSYKLFDKRLGTVILGGVWPREILVARRPEILTWLLSVLGEPFETGIRLIQRKGVFYIPVLQWAGDGSHVAFSYSPSLDPESQPFDLSREKFAPYFFELIISDDKITSLRNVNLLPVSDLSSHKYEALFADWVAVGGYLPAIKSK